MGTETPLEGGGDCEVRRREGGRSVLSYPGKGAQAVGAGASHREGPSPGHTPRALVCADGVIERRGVSMEQEGDLSLHTDVPEAQ